MSTEEGLHLYSGFMIDNATLEQTFGSGTRSFEHAITKDNNIIASGY